MRHTGVLPAALVLMLAAFLLPPATASARDADGKRPSKRHWHGYGFLPGYEPPEVVEWRNTSRFNHTVTADPTQGHATLPPSAESFSSQELRPGASFRHTFTAPGNYTYFCQPHEGIGMVGQIIVLAK